MKLFESRQDCRTLQDTWPIPSIRAQRSHRNDGNMFKTKKGKNFVGEKGQLCSSPNDKKHPHEVISSCTLRIRRKPREACKNSSFLLHESCNWKIVQVSSLVLPKCKKKKQGTKKLTAKCAGQKNKKTWDVVKIVGPGTWLGEKVQNVSERCGPTQNVGFRGRNDSQRQEEPQEARIQKLRLQ